MLGKRPLFRFEVHNTSSLNKLCRELKLVLRSGSSRFLLDPSSNRKKTAVEIYATDKSDILRLINFLIKRGLLS